MYCKCGNNEFYAHQLCRMDIVVDGENNFLRNPMPVDASIYDSETPYGPYTCTKCGAEYDELTDSNEIELIGHKFQIVHEIPLGYSIWNIGKNMPDGWLPFCRLAANQPFDGGQAIDTDTLKVIPLKEAQEVLAAANYAGTIREMEQRLLLKKISANERQKLENALAILKTIHKSS